MPISSRTASRDFRFRVSEEASFGLVSTGKRSTMATGVRFGVAMAFNRHGDLFVTDQEGETWLPGGNPLDELLHIRQGKHYGFPPRHSVYLPDVFDEPATATYGPQHQSTCGLTFNESSPGHRSFGPSFWEGDAIVSGYSRGKVWRTKLAKTEVGYVSQTELIASARMLLIDSVVSPAGDLVVAAHSGQPDWGRGPTGPGTLFKVTCREMERPQPVLAWPESPVEVHIAFDRPVHNVAIKEATIECGAHVRAGDRFEYHRPGYESVRRQTLAPRFPLLVQEHHWEDEGRTLVLLTDPHALLARYAVTLTLGGVDSISTTSINLDYALSGVEVRARRHSGDPAKVVGWLPHIDHSVNKQLTVGCDIMTSLAARFAKSEEMILRTVIQPWLGEGDLLLTSATAFDVLFDKTLLRSQGEKDSRHSIRLAIKEIRPVEIVLRGGLEPAALRVSFVPANFPDPRPVPLEAFRLPWASDREAPREPPVVTAPEIVEGDWYRGKKLFFSSESQCSACHRKGTEGGVIGPDLSNLIHRDAGSVRRDIIDPNAAINPDYVPLVVLLSNGEVVSGLMRPKGKDDLMVFDSSAKERIIPLADIDEYKSSQVSIMPAGYAEKLGTVAMRDLLTFLTQPEPKPPASAEGKVPPVRTRAEVDSLLAAVPFDDNMKLRPLNIVLVAGAKDHDPGEHDYPIWQRRWKELLSKSAQVRVSSAFDWPDQSQFDLADVMIFYCWNHAWTREKYDQLAKYAARGGGLVMIHSATIADKEPGRA